MLKEELLEYLKSIRCRSRGKSGEQVATECIKLVEEKFVAPNTGSPKFPTLDEVNAMVQLERLKISPFEHDSRKIIKLTYDYMCRKLRAGA